ncbi:WYL domain-containing protein [Paenibacillus albicereus]|uniref:WYL domain-containing protein n=1 Tax=Paenibacillus albicereus TaxID=2726185 RepID=A0A6H2GUF2_9BACL|nr:WYL domain-containing protein [Paenibacillus albicereus]QJC51051.1 WYL domain-containing protein [Paenibacillus albicereus]
MELLFDKAHNHELSRRMAEAGAVAVTGRERAWLRLMLEHPAAEGFLGAAARAKLAELLAAEEPLPLGHLVEKARSRERRLFSPLLPELAELVARRSGMRLAYSAKGGGALRHAEGYPYRLDYAMSTKQWYLLWHRASGRPLMRTRLTHVHGVEERPLPPGEADRLDACIAALSARSGETTVLELVPRYNRELSRILYALSCFRQEVRYDADEGVYRIELAYARDERGFLLQKLRFLGKRVRVLEGAALQEQMRASAVKALARYGIRPEAEAAAEAGAVAGAGVEAEAGVEARAVAGAGGQRGSGEAAGLTSTG